MISLGVFPDVPLKQARERKLDARRLIANGVDPSVKRHVERVAKADTFEVVSREWIGRLARPPTLGANSKRKRRPNGPLDVKTIRSMTRRFERFVFPQLGTRPIATITAAELLAMLRRIEARGTHESSHIRCPLQ
jgi:hypothetical protein